MMELTAMSTDRNRDLERARKALVGGVNSPVRSFSQVGLDPLLAERAEGPWIEDSEGNRYLDLIGGWGAAILGHSPPPIVDAVTRAIGKGSHFGLTHRSEIDLAEAIIERCDGVDRVRFANSGTEAVMTAVKLAQAHTGRQGVGRFSGSYHGHSPATMENGSGCQPSYELPYNDVAAAERWLPQWRESLSCVIVEPVAGNAGLIPPQPGFLEALRELTRDLGILLIFDEVMTGFRVARGGAVERFGIEPDLVTMGKIIGGGFPIGAVAGPAGLLERLAPLGEVYHAGTFAGNPVSMTAGLATLQQLTAPVYKALERAGAMLEAGLVAAATRAGVRMQVQRVGSMISVFFSETRVQNYEQARRSNRQAYASFFAAMMAHGVLLPPSPLESWFLSTAHSDSDLQTILDAADQALINLPSLPSTDSGSEL